MSDPKFVLFLALVLSLVACKPEEKKKPIQNPVQQAGYWEPLTEGIIKAIGVLAQPPSTVPPEVYKRNRREALEKVVEKLSGRGTRRSWNFSKALLRRERSEEVVEEIIRFLNRYLSSELQTSVAKNAIQVMGSAQNPAFAKALLLASSHSDRTVREEALKALVQSGDVATTDALVESYHRADTREKALRVRVLAERWPPEKAVPFLRGVMAGTGPEAPVMREQVLLSFKEVKAPADTIRGVFEDNLFHYKGLDLISAASLLHKSGGEQGRLELLRLLAEESNPKILQLLISGLSQRVPAESLEAIDTRLQQLSTGTKTAGRDPIVQAVLASYLGLIGEENEIARLEVMARFEDSRIAHAALEALRGKKARLDWIALAIETGTGSDLRRGLEDAVAAQDRDSIAAMKARLAKAVGADKRRYLQALGRSRVEEAIPPLLETIRAEPVVVIPSAGLDSCSYASQIIANIPDSEEPLWQLYESLGQDLVRRSLVIDALGRLALLGQDEAGKARKARIHARFRTLFMDPETNPRERLQLLGSMLMHSLEMADAMRLKRLLRKEKGTEKVFLDTINNLLFELF